MATLEQLGSEKYLLLTTYRKDGRGVPTPLWVVPDGAGLMVWTPAGTGKVKRIRNNPTVEVTACDLRGKPRGETLKGTARILDAAGTERGRKVLRKKYGIAGHVVIGSSKVFRGQDGTVCLAITLD